MSSRSRVGRTLHFISLILRSTASEARVASSKELFKSMGGGMSLGSQPTYESLTI